MQGRGLWCFTALSHPSSAPVALTPYNCLEYPTIPLLHSPTWSILPDPYPCPEVSFPPTSHSCVGYLPLHHALVLNIPIVPQTQGTYPCAPQPCLGCHPPLPHSPVWGITFLQSPGWDICTPESPAWGPLLPKSPARGTPAYSPTAMCAPGEHVYVCTFTTRMCLSVHLCLCVSLCMCESASLCISMSLSVSLCVCVSV